MPARRLDQNSDDKFAKDLMVAIKPLADGALGGIRPGWVSLLHIARQVKAAPQSEEPERFLFWGGAGQFVDHLAKVSSSRSLPRARALFLMGFVARSS